MQGGSVQAVQTDLGQRRRGAANTCGWEESLNEPLAGRATHPDERLKGRKDGGKQVVPGSCARPSGRRG